MRVIGPLYPKVSDGSGKTQEPGWVLAPCPVGIQHPGISKVHSYM